MEIQRNEIKHPVPATELVVPIRPFTFRLRVESRTAPMRIRRALLLILFRELKPKFGEMVDARIYQKDGWLLNWYQELRRKISLRQAPDLGTQQKNLGFEIRALRLQLGWTQAQLAALAHVNVGHLSEIERGLRRPRALTLRKIGKALFMKPEVIRSLTTLSAETPGPRRPCRNAQSRRPTRTEGLQLIPQSSEQIE